MPGRKPHNRPTRRPPRPAQRGGQPAADRRAAVTGLRIIGGTFRGRRLTYHGDPHTRPMKDRVREAVFNLVWPGAQGAVAIDLFAGTGALGLEALSRGAIAAWLIERDRQAVKAIRENVDRLAVAEAAQVVGADAFSWGPRAVSGVLGARPEPWLVFCSPPYEFYESRRRELLELLQSLAAAAPPGSTFVVESDRRFDPTELPTALEWDVRRYPPAVIAIGRHH